MEQFTIHEILENKLKELKIELYEDFTYRKSCILFDIWKKQKELGYLFDLYSVLEENKTIDMGEVITYSPSNSYKEQYIKFLMNHDLVFLHEIQDPKILIHLIYYWLINQIKHDKLILNNI